MGMTHFHTRCLQAPRSLLMLLTLAAGACGAWQRVGREVAEPDPTTYVTPLFDLEGVYNGMGLFGAQGTLPFTGSLHYLAGPSPDSTLALFGLSMSHHSFSFRRTEGVFEARYRVEVTFHRGGRLIDRTSEDNVIQVVSFPETQRTDDAILYQTILYLPPGVLDVSVRVSDRGGDLSTEATSSTAVPRFTGSKALSQLVPVYRARGRRARAAEPALVVNPRASVPFGADTLLLYAEGYRGDSADVVTVRAFTLDPEPVEVWRDSLLLGTGGIEVNSILLTVRPALLPIGQLELAATVSGVPDTMRTPILVTFSDQWVVANLDETLSLLRYFGAEQALQAIRAAAPEERAALWRRLWRETDPDPATPGHEALDIYFGRVEEANDRFREATQPGWLTDRGEVFITLGAPDEIFDSSSDLQDRGIRLIRWHYIGDRLTLDFVDESGFGRFRLTDRSRSDYLRVLTRLRQGE
jgi:GWxTD domain-containing protein